MLALLTIRPNPDFHMIPTLGNGQDTAIKVTDVKLSDEFGGPISGGARTDGAFRVRALQGDVDFSCSVNVALDGQAVAGRFGITQGEALYEARYDLEGTVINGNPALGPITWSGDGDIDILDVQFVFGRDTSTCASPIPSPQ